MGAFFRRQHNKNVKEKAGENKAAVFEGCQGHE